MDYPNNVLKIAKAAAVAHPLDATKATNLAIRNLSKLKDFTKLRAVFIHNAVRDLIYDSRCQVNKVIKGQHSSPKVIVGTSPSVQEAAVSAYDLFISGVTLGEVLGGDLDDIGDSEQAVGYGHLFNAELCWRLAKIVPEYKRVRDAVSENKLQAIMREVRKKLG